MAALILALGAPALAQGTVTSPKGYLTTEGDRFSYWLGRYAEGRYQVADGELRNQAMAITRIDFRLDNRGYASTIGTGRTWSRVTVDMAETDVELLSQNWALNATSTPTHTHTHTRDFNS